MSPSAKRSASRFAIAVFSTGPVTTPTPKQSNVGGDKHMIKMIKMMIIMMMMMMMMMMMINQT
jgi:hypothetical protein